MAKSSESADATETTDSYRAALDSSVIAGVVHRATDVVETATDTAAVTSALETVGRWTRQSRLYRWLTTEPDPEVIVIDLRETYTVGPVLAVLDRIVGVLQRNGQTSALTRAGKSLQTRATSAPIRLAGIVVAVAVLANFLVTAALGTLSTSGGVVRVLVLALALVATRVRAPWSVVRDSRTVRVLRALLEPPEAPEE